MTLANLFDEWVEIDEPEADRGDGESVGQKINIDGAGRASRVRLH